jgi:lysophospholipase L1-like esterase
VSFFPLARLTLCFAALALEAAAAPGQWTGSWFAAQMDVDAKSLPPPPGLQGVTLRQYVMPTLAGTRVRITISNRFGHDPLVLSGARIAVARAGGAIDSATDHALAFGGLAGVTIEGEAQVVSDPVEMSLPALQRVAVTLVIAQAPRETTSHPASHATSYLCAGDFASAEKLPSAVTTTHWYFLTDLEVWNDTPAGAVLAFGDSITDGSGSVLDADNRWPDNLSRRLQADPALRSFAVLNAGIGGNRLLRPGAGPSALSRFDRDVLGEPGVRTVIVLEGINDIGTRVSARAHGTTYASAADLIFADEQLIARAHAHGLRILGATVTPYGGAGYASDDGEADRETLNSWIRTPGHFDGVVDFDAAVRDPANPKRFASAYDNGDHLHPSEAGYVAMANSVDLASLQLGSPAVAGRRPRMPWDLSPAEKKRLGELNEADHADMMAQLGITRLRPGPSGTPGQPNPANTDEAKANPYPNYPDPLLLADGKAVTAPAQWWRERRPQIVEDYEREILGRVPNHVPAVTWSVIQTLQTEVGGNPAVAKELIGHVDNSADPQIQVDLHMWLAIPAKAKAPVPVLMMFGFGAQPGTPDFWFGPPGSEPSDPPSTTQLIADGWGYVSIDTSSIQADNGAGLTQGIIGLCNEGHRRRPEDWGSLRAWAWGASRGLDYLETDPAVDARRVGIEGVSRYGKAALVTMAFDPRFAVALIGSSGEGGAKPYRRNFGEAVENLASSGEYHWLAGNFLKYAAAASKFGSRDANDMPVDSPELIALCAPRPTFISYGIPAKGDASWLDQQGSYMATVDASRVFVLLGAKGIAPGADYRTAVMPHYNTGLLDGQLAWRQHDQGHQDRSNMKYFLPWADGMLNRVP